MWILAVKFAFIYSCRNCLGDTCVFWHQDVLELESSRLVVYMQDVEFRSQACIGLGQIFPSDNEANILAKGNLI